MVIVDVEDGNARTSPFSQGLGGDRSVVEEAVPTHEVGPGVMAGRAGCTKGTALASGEPSGRARCCISTCLGRDPRSCGQRTAVVHGIQTKLRNEVDGFPVTA